MHRPPAIRLLAPQELTAAQEIAADDPLPAGELDRYRRAGLAWAAVAARPVAGR